jgi:hypothetical protein
MGGSAWLALLSGCTLAGDEGDATRANTTAEPPTGTPSETPTSGTASTQEPVSLSEKDFEFGVDVTRQFTEEHPARVRATFTNAGDTPVVLGEGPTLPFSGYFGRHEASDARLILIPDDTSPLGKVLDRTPTREVEGFVPEKPIEGCWTEPHEVLIEGLYMERPLKPGESVEVAYTVLDYRNETCLPAGPYRFGTDAIITAETTRSPDEQSRYTANYGFAVDVAEDRTLSVDIDGPAIAEHDH